MNPYLDLHRDARSSNDWQAISDATMARDLWAAGAVPSAAGHARLARDRLALLVPVASVWTRCQTVGLYGAQDERSAP